MRVYFDNAASTPLSEEVIAAMLESMRQLYGNPSSIHAEGRTVRAAIEQARKKVAHYLGASIGEIFFTSGGSESNNMALKGAVRDLGIQRIISSPTEHPCVLNPLANLKKTGTKVEFVKVDNKGRIDFENLEQLLQKENEKTLVSIMHANNEIGTLQSLDRLSELCQSHDALLHSDSVQTIGHLPIDVSKTKIHFLCGSAHKFHGPKGAGFIYINNEIALKPFIEGGSQERSMRAGTENVYGIIGLAKALELACENREEHRQHIDNLRSYFIRQLLENFEDIQFIGDYEGSYLYKVLSVSFPPSSRSDLLVLNLDIAGVSASGGSACSSGAEVGSHVLNAIKADLSRKAIRFSFSHYNTKKEIDFVVEKLKTMVARRTVGSLQ